MRPSDLSRVKLQLFGNLIEMNLKRVSRLRRAVASLGTAWRFIREDPYTLEFVAWHFISHSLQRARIERAGDAVTAIGSTVEESLEVHPGDRAILLDAGLDVH